VTENEEAPRSVDEVQVSLRGAVWRVDLEDRSGHEPGGPGSCRICSTAKSRSTAPTPIRP